jgi:hypothetical protein
MGCLGVGFGHVISFLAFSDQQSAVSSKKAMRIHQMECSLARFAIRSQRFAVLF